MPTESLPTIGAVTLVALFLLKEVFSYLKSRKENGNGNGFTQSILNELQHMNNNHLHTIDETLRQGNDRLVDTIHNDNSKIIELLAEIKGRLK